MAEAFVRGDPAAQQISIQPVAERHGPHRDARLLAGRDHVGLERGFIRAAMPPSEGLRLNVSVHVSAYMLMDTYPLRLKRHVQYDIPGRIRPKQLPVP